MEKAVSAGTELYDLFGETGTCTICQDDLKEGERVCCIKACQHLFHNHCVAPWLKTKGTCPLCRQKVETTAAPRTSEEVEASIRRTQQTLYELYALILEMRDNPSTRNTPVLNQVIGGLQQIVNSRQPQ